MAVNYTRHAIELYRMSEAEIAAKFNRDLTRAVRFLPKRREAALQFVEMHKRHGEIVYHVLRLQLQQHVGRLLEGGLEESSMLAMVMGQRHLESS